MKNKFKRTASAVLAAAMLIMSLPTASAKLIGLNGNHANKETTPREGAVAETPEEYLFTYDGTEFILLDSEEKNGKTYFFILCEDVYGTHNFKTGQEIGYWEPEETDNIAYWLNHDFLENGNDGKKLPAGIIKHIDMQHEWNTEPRTVLASKEGYEKYGSELVTYHGLAVISNYEWQKYVSKIGQNVASHWWFRTMRNNIGGGDCSTVLYTGSVCAVGTNNSWNVGRSPIYVRPCFWISEDFFKEYKVTNAGSDVIVNIDPIVNADLYTDAEKKAMIKVEASDVKVVGEPIVGETLTASYTYKSGFAESDSAFEWYESDSETGDYTKISGADKKNFKLTNNQQGKYIKVSVTPKSVSKLNPYGNAVLAQETFGYVFGEKQINDAINNINSASADNVFDAIDAANVVFKVDTELDYMGSSSRDNVAVIFSKMNYNDVESVRDCYNKAVTLENLNLAGSEAEVDAFLKDDTFVNTERYSQLKSNEYVVNAVYQKDFNDYAEFEKTFSEAVAVSDFDEADRNNVKTILKAHSNILTADISKLSDYRLGIAGAEILKNSYSDFDTLDKAVTEAVNVASNAEDVVKADEASDINSSKKPEGTVSGVAPSIAYRQEKIPLIETPTDEQIEEVSVFYDLSAASWAKDAILKLNEKGIVSGYENGSFKPNNILKREEFALMVVNAFYKGEIVNTSANFVDVAPNSWYAAAVDLAAEKGIISGMGDNIFGVGNELTREDMVLILYRLISDKKEVEAKTFTDDNVISDYAKEAVGYMAAEGLVNGLEDGSFNPKGTATRAMAAKVLYDVLNYIEA